MKKNIIVIACILCNTFLFAESEYSLKEYFKTNILKLDPIEGEYDCQRVMKYVTPYVNDTERENWVYYIKEAYPRSKIFSLYVKDSSGFRQSSCCQITRIGETNAYYFHYHSSQARMVLENETFFRAVVPLQHRDAIRVSGNPNLSATLVKITLIYECIKTYPCSSMYLEAAKEDAKKAELEYQKALEEAKRKAGWSGTGFALYQGHIVTNNHVVEDAKTILIKGIKGDFNTEYRATVVATDKTNDLAVLKIDDERFSSFGSIPYKIKKSMSDVGESVWALGYPMTSVMGDEIKFTDGKISSRTGIQGDMSVYQISVPIQPGNSGGPLFDNYGNIVGITSSGLNREEFNSENVNYAIKTSYLYNLIESAITTSILPQGTAMQGQTLTQKIKLAKNFVFMVLCSSDPNFHSEHTDNIQQKEIISEIQSSSNAQINNNIQKDSIPYVISNPIYNRTSNLEILKITIDSTYTILDCKWKNREYYNGICRIRKETYIQTPDSSAKFKLLQVKGIAYYPNETKVPYQQTVFFSLYFEALPIKINKFDLIEPNGWKILDILIE
jgi:S1-C subfamily serine protease